MRKGNLLQSGKRLSTTDTREPQLLDFGVGKSVSSSHSSSSAATGRVAALTSVVPLLLPEELAGGLDDPELGFELNDVAVDPEEGSLLDDEDI